jgi:hypothetical protein
MSDISAIYGTDRVTYLYFCFDPHSCRCTESNGLLAEVLNYQCALRIMNISPETLEKLYFHSKLSRRQLSQCIMNSKVKRPHLTFIIGYTSG